MIVFCAFKMFHLVLICYSNGEVFWLTVTWSQNFWNQLSSRCYPFSMHQTLIQRAPNSGWNAFHQQTSKRRLCFIPVGPTHNCVIWQGLVWAFGVSVAQSNLWYKYGSWTLYLTYWSSWLRLVIGVIPVNQRPLVRDGHSIRLINGHLVLCVVSLDITGRRFIYIVLVHPAAIGYQLNLLTLG